MSSPIGPRMSISRSAKPSMTLQSVAYHMYIEAQDLSAKNVPSASSIGQRCLKPGSLKVAPDPVPMEQEHLVDVHIMEGAVSSRRLPCGFVVLAVCHQLRLRLTLRRAERDPSG